jgi:hypothetical protein
MNYHSPFFTVSDSVQEGLRGIGAMLDCPKVDYHVEFTQWLEWVTKVAYQFALAMRKNVDTR